MDIITGGAGLLGSELAFQLIRSGHEVCSIVRPNRQHPDVWQRQIASIAQLHPEVELTQDEQRRLRVCSGDISCNNLLLDYHVVSEIRQAKPRCLWNCAADIRYDPRFSTSIFCSNVAGVHQVLRFAETVAVDWLHHVSTAFISPVTNGTACEFRVAEGAESGARNLYEQTKISGEAMLWKEARVPFCIHRTSILIGPGNNGCISDSGGHLGFIRGLFTLAEFLRKQNGHTHMTGLTEVFKIPGNPAIPMNIVPVDFAVSEMLAIQNLPLRQNGDIFHIVDENPLTTNQHLKLASECLDWPGLRWSGTDLNSLSPLENVFAGILAAFQVQYCLTAPANFSVRAGGRKPRQAVTVEQLRAQIHSACKQWSADTRKRKATQFLLQKALKQGMNTQ